MRRKSRLATRMVVATVLCGLLGFASSRFVWKQVTYAALLRFHQPLADYTWETYERSRCEASPDTWSMSLDRGARTYAYDDVSTLTLAQPGGACRSTSRSGATSRAARISVAIGPHGATLASGGALVHRTAASGPCAIVQTTWGAQPLEGDFLTWIPLGFVFTAVAAGGHRHLSGSRGPSSASSSGGSRSSGTWPTSRTT